MFYPTVDDVGAPDAMLDGLKGVGDLREHAPVNGAIIDEIGDLLGRETGEYLALGIKEPRGVGKQNQLFRIHRFRQPACHHIGVNVVGGPILPDADGGDNGDVLEPTSKSMTARSM